MAKPEHVEIARRGAEAITDFHRKNQEIRLDLSSARLRSANLSGADLNSANLGDVDLIDADLSDADLSGAYLSFADLSGKSIGVTRGAIEDQELTKLAPAGTDIKRFEDNNATVSAFVSGQTQLIATGASVAGNMMGKNPQLGTEYKLLLKDSPNFIGVAKGEDKLRLKVNEIIAEGKKNGDIDKMAMKWLGRPAGDLPQ